MATLTLVVLFVLFLATFAAASMMWSWYHDQQCGRLMRHIDDLEHRCDELFQASLASATELRETQHQYAYLECRHADLVAICEEAVIAYEQKVRFELSEQDVAALESDPWHAGECLTLREMDTPHADQCGCDECWDAAIVRGGHPQEWKVASCENHANHRNGCDACFAAVTGGRSGGGDD